MQVLVIGGGGREYALAKKLSESKLMTALYLCPGNGGTESLGHNLRLPVAYPYQEICEFVHKQSIDLVIIGPEKPLVEGLADRLEEMGIMTFGVSKSAALLEGSKSYAKTLMTEAGIQTANYQLAHNQKEALEILREHSMPCVIKADGLCAGKGVMILYDDDDVKQAMRIYYKEKRFGSAGNLVLIEDFLMGREVSLMAFCDGKTIRLLPACQDYKRLEDGNKGPNTGGMGVISPVPWFDQTHVETAISKIFEPLLRSLRRRKIAYRGVIYAGLIVHGKELSVLEFNVRFGDPECQCVLPLLKTDLLETILGTCTGELNTLPFDVMSTPTVNVVMAQKGYPERVDAEYRLHGHETLSQEVQLFYAGVKKNQLGQLTSSGGRVLSVTATGDTLEDARIKAYENVKRIRFEGAYYRQDIGIL